MFVRFSELYYNIMLSFYEDILDIDYDGFGVVKIFCKPNYNIDRVLFFTENHIPIECDYEIIVLQDYGLNNKEEVNG